MTNQVATTARRPQWLFLLSAFVVVGALTAMLVGGPAQAASSRRGVHAATPSGGQAVHVADTTCPTDYGGTTVPCTTSTTTPISTTLTISYSNGIITWRDCGYPGVAIGTTVQLFLDGQAVTIAGGAGAILSGGCTPTLSFPLCLSPGNFSAVAVDNGFPPEQATLVVTNSGSCANPQTGLGLHFGNVPPANKGPLAFTGTNILRLLLIALLALLLGLAITAANRRRRHAR